MRSNLFKNYRLFIVICFILLSLFILSCEETIVTQEEIICTVDTLDANLFGTWRTTLSSEGVEILKIYDTGIFERNIYSYKWRNSYTGITDCIVTTENGKYNIEEDNITFYSVAKIESIGYEFFDQDRFALKIPEQHGTRYLNFSRLDSKYKLSGHCEKLFNTEPLIFNEGFVEINNEKFPLDNDGYYEISGLPEDMYHVKIKYDQNVIASKWVYLSNDKSQNFQIEYSDYFPLLLGNQWTYKINKARRGSNRNIKEYEGRIEWEIIAEESTSEKSVYTFNQFSEVAYLNLISHDPNVYDTVEVVDTTTTFTVEYSIDGSIKFLDDNLMFANVSIPRYLIKDVHQDEEIHAYGSHSEEYNSITTKVNIGLIDYYHQVGTSHNYTTENLKLLDFSLKR